MKPSTLADLLGVSGMTLRRWSDRFEQFLTPAATPPAGENRSFQHHDQRVMLLIRDLRDANIKFEDIEDRLHTEKENDYATLPDVPAEWAGQPEETIALSLAGARASEMVSIATLQTQLQHANQQIADIKQQFQEARERAEKLEHELSQARASQTATAGQKQALELELERARSDARELQARLGAYTLGGERPVSPLLLIVGALVAGAVLVALAFVLASLLL